MVSWLISDNCFISLNTTGFRFLWPNHAYLIFFCTDNMLAFVYNKTGLFWALCRGKKRFPFLFLNYAIFPFYRIRDMLSFVCREILLFFTLLHREKDFYFLLQNYIVCSVAAWEKRFSFWRIEGQITLFLALMYRKHALVCSAPDCVVFSFLHGKGFFISQLNRAVLSCISRATRFFLFCFLITPFWALSHNKTCLVCFRCFSFLCY